MWNGKRDDDCLLCKCPVLLRIRMIPEMVEVDPGYTVCLINSQTKIKSVSAAIPRKPSELARCRTKLTLQ